MPPDTSPLIEPIPAEVLSAVQQHFHEVIVGRVADQVNAYGVALPDLSGYADGTNARGWLPIPGMMGGFKYFFERGGQDALLVSESWSRVVEGSGQRHHVTAQGASLIDSEFV